ncbi:MAG: MATE family efflux transporter [Bacteroidetes bacterium]|nr:MATE family efflux transporter [Bacteroidota bacterium]MBK9542480.1 MATE family efflux transporter [Bacteroidota bacterium]MBP6648987.1 MATE family efflux transporter [Bacteroidia bacterium]
MQIKTSYRDILNMAYPVIIGSLATTLLNITDTAFLGRVGEVELGASAVGGVLYFVFVMIGIAIGIGTQILIARRSGEKNEGAIGEIFDHSLIILSGLSLFLFILLEYFSPLLLRMILDSEPIIQASIRFLHYRAYGIFFIMIATVFRSFYVGIAQPRVYGIYSFLMAIVNVILGYLLIFGNYGFPKMGIEGAGLASSIAELIALIYLFGYTMVKPGIKQFHLFRFIRINWNMISRIFNLSAPLVVQNLLSMGAWFVFFVFIEKIGEHELAISNIVRGAYMVAMTPIWGFSIAANSMISNIIGQGKSEEVIGLLNRIIKLALWVTGIMALINVLIPRLILSIFTSDQQLINDSMGSFYVVILAMVFFAFAIVCISAVSGTGATRTALYIEIAAILIYMIYNYVVTFIFKGTVEMVWFSEIIYWVFTGIASYIYLRTLRWKKIIL